MYNTAIYTYMDIGTYMHSFQLHYGLGVDSASKRNEYQEITWGLKAACPYG